MQKKVITIFFLALLLPFFAPTLAQANIMDTQQAKVEHMRACLSNGGKKDICACSFDRALGTLSATDLINVNRALTNKIPANPKHLDVLSRITRKCVRDIEKGQYNPDAEAVAPTPAKQPQSFDDLNNFTIPQPPELEKSTPNFSQENTEEYFDEPEISQEQLKLEKEQAERARRAAAIEVDNLKDSYKGQYDKLFFKAAGTGDMQALKAIIQYLPNVDIIDNAGNTPLIVATAAGQTRSMNFLIENMANVNHRNKEGQQAIHVAVFNGKQEPVRVLLTNKADINSVYGEGFSPLHLAIMRKDESLLQTLIISGAKVGIALTDGNLPIHIATSADAPQIIQILHNYGADLNAENPQGYTPLLIASSQNKAAAASTLLALGADYAYSDIYGRTPLQIASSLGYQQIVNLILTVQEQKSR
jgi:ankyrin repeat protein